MEVVSIILRVLIVLASIGLVAFVLLQPSNDGMSSALTGVSEDNLRSSARKSRPEKRYAFLTKVIAAAIGVLCLVCVFVDKF